MVRRASNRNKPPSDAALLRMCRSGWAWEWLRRNGDYQASKDIGAFVRRRVIRETPMLTIIELERPHQSRWGLCFAEDPDRPFHHAAVFWNGDVDPAVCPVAATPAPRGAPSCVLDLERLKIAATVLVMPSGEQHVVLCDGIHALQLHVRNGSVVGGPVRLAYELQNFEKLPEHAVTIERLGSVLSRARFPSELLAKEPNADRWLLALKAIELEAVGHSHAEIADRLYPGSDQGNFTTDWRRSRVRRLLEAGHALIKGDYLKILSRSPKLKWHAA